MNLIPRRITYGFIGLGMVIGGLGGVGFTSMYYKINMHRQCEFIKGVDPDLADAVHDISLGYDINVLDVRDTILGIPRKGITKVLCEGDGFRVEGTYSPEDSLMFAILFEYGPDSLESKIPEEIKELGLPRFVQKSRQRYDEIKRKRTGQPLEQSLKQEPYPLQGSYHSRS